MPSRTNEPAVMVHGGAGTSRQHADGCRSAVEAALAALERGGDAMTAAIGAVMHLEDDGRFNAGRGADLGLDGETVEMCASVMDSAGTLGAVTCVRDVRHPVQLAHAISKTPHWCLTGEGADRFARRIGLQPARHDRAAALEKHRKVMREMQAGTPQLPGVDNAVFPSFWNYPLDWHEAIRRHGGGTVGAAVRDCAGVYAVATSTGGSSPALLGRVGDSAIVGSGFYCGPLGAIGATGIGEQIVRHLLARTVYGWVLGGRPLQDALDAGVALFPQDIDVGLIGVTADACATASNRDMPTASFGARA